MQVLCGLKGGFAFLFSRSPSTALTSRLGVCSPSQLLQYTGTLVLGVGDALVSGSVRRSLGANDLSAIQASIVGKRLGRHRWLATSPKTVEGSAAFALSIVVCAWVLRVLGFSEHFSVRQCLRG